ncbi:hypothetical protein ACM34P_001290 [Cronobacter sakazakii]|uniref:hypothetical protein n=1 Tax=Cronobacter sakazakii TaxID=28141 RepID=UPI001056C5DB|nr:hypothetical protein [Cronobacter sakazakii]ELQ6225019.1 hypothetical protein [Cronobacter turicensis]EKA1095134.1 hypothetical protein [Cronobacter sakazakii]ELY2521083.1 hypothetical protein [Cronobacter sakazakii]ELY2912579.1 hypothetical protein [Cronobacter sakazakii]ELY4755674.1 hypothetical protein [Cronobacter sakazakii]
MRKLVCFIAFLSTCGFGYQAYHSHNLSTGLALLASLVVLLTAVANLISDKKKSQSIHQTIGNNSSGIQIGGDLNINSKDKK